MKIDPKKLQDFDCVVLKDGREGFVLENHPELNFCYVEFSYQDKNKYPIDYVPYDGLVIDFEEKTPEPELNKIFGEKSIEGQIEAGNMMPADIRESDEVLLKNGERGYIREIYSADFFLLDRIDELTDELDSTFTVRLADIDRILSRFEERCPYLAKMDRNPDMLANEKSKGQAYRECAFSVKIRPIYHYGDVEQEKNQEKQ